MSQPHGSLSTTNHRQREQRYSALVVTHARLGMLADVARFGSSAHHDSTPAIGTAPWASNSNSAPAERWSRFNSSTGRVAPVSAP
jgi:hypothetical protein